MLARLFSKIYLSPVIIEEDSDMDVDMSEEFGWDLVVLEAQLSILPNDLLHYLIKRGEEDEGDRRSRGLMNWLS